MPEATAVTGGYDANSDSRIRAPLREWVVAQKAASPYLLCQAFAMPVAGEQVRSAGFRACRTLLNG